MFPPIRPVQYRLNFWPVPGQLSAFNAERQKRTEPNRNGHNWSLITVTGFAPQGPLFSRGRATRLAGVLGYKFSVLGASGARHFRVDFTQMRASVAALSRDIRGTSARIDAASPFAAA
jgi:hypothetical protein